MNDNKAGDNKCTFRVIHLNIQGLTSHKVNEWDLFLMENKMHDAICVTEHWFSPEIADSCSSGGWHVASIFSRTKKSRGGSMILSRNHDYEVLGNIVSLSVEFDCEIAAIKTQKLTLISIYRSTNGDFGNFLEILENVLNLVDIHDDLAIAGDFNVFFSMYGNDTLDRNAVALVEVLESYGLKQTIFEPTRMDKL